MEEKLEAFAAKCHQILKADSGPSGIEEVRSNLEPLLSDENFVSIYPSVVGRQCEWGRTD